MLLTNDPFALLGLTCFMINSVLCLDGAKFLEYQSGDEILFQMIFNGKHTWEYLNYFILIGLSMLLFYDFYTNIIDTKNTYIFKSERVNPITAMKTIIFQIFHSQIQTH